MTRFILIDSNSGYVWGEATARAPEDACALVDISNGETQRDYSVYAPAARVEASHYLVYAAGDDTPAIDDGQDSAQVALVSALPLVARVAYRD